MVLCGVGAFIDVWVLITIGGWGCWRHVCLFVVQTEDCECVVDVNSRLILYVDGMVKCTVVQSASMYDRVVPNCSLHLVTSHNNSHADYIGHSSCAFIK